MKLLVTFALIVAALAAATPSFASHNTDPQFEGSFEVAQRFCPNRRC